MSEPRELHFLSPDQKLRIDNGSALVTVASRLRGASSKVGDVVLVGGDPEPGLRGAVNGFSYTGSGRFQSFANTCSRYLLGVSVVPPYSIHRSLHRLSPSVVVLHNLPWAGPVVRSTYRRAKLVLWVHNKILQRLSAGAVRQALAVFDLIVCVSDFIRLDLQSRAGLRDDNRFHTVRNAIDPRSLTEFVEAGADVVYVGRLIKEKGVHKLLEAAARSGSKWRIKIVGGRYFYEQDQMTPYELSLHQYAADQGLEVAFTGPVPPASVSIHLDGAKVAVVPSVWDEPCGLALLEAMQSAAAAVAFAVGGMKELSDKGGVVYVAPNSIEELGDVISGLLADEANRAQVAARGRTEVSARPWRAARLEFEALLN